MGSLTHTPVSIKRAYIDSPLLALESQPDAQLHYRYALPRSPTSKPSFILLHKSASSSASFVPLIPLLVSQGHACYAPDMPGFGQSTPPDFEPATKGTDWYCHVFAEMLRTLGLMSSEENKGIHIIGHHSGATLGIELASLFPSQILGLTLVGATVMNSQERTEMKSHYFDAFNAPKHDGSHLNLNWNYLINMGVGTNLDLRQREFLDHCYAWRGRQQIYGAVWKQKTDELFKQVECKVLALCAPDDVLWKFFGNIKTVRPDDGVVAKECQGANFSLDLDAENIAKMALDLAGEADGKNL